MANRIPPQNVEAEQSVLGAMLLDNEGVNEIVDLLNPDDFYRESHKHICEAILELIDKQEPADLVTLTNLLKLKGKLDAVGGAAYLATLVESVPTAANRMHYAKIVKDKAVLRGVIHAATDIVTMGFEESSEVSDFLDKAEKAIFEIAGKRDGKQGLVPIAPVIKDSFLEIEKNYERKELITGLATGFREIDKITAGLHDSDLVIVAARPAMGKTSLCLNIAEHVAMKLHQSVAIFSLEMSREQLVMRMLCSGARIDSLKVRTGLLDEDEWRRLTNVAGPLSEANIYIDDTSQINPFELKARCRRLKAAKGLGLVIVDYLQLMSSRGRAESREREISDISRSLKAMAKELQVPVIALSQLNRSVESRQDKRPQLSDLRESGAIEQDADMVGFIYRDEVYNKESADKGIAEFIIVKHRHGPTGVAKLAFLSEYTRFENLAAQYGHDE